MARKKRRKKRPEKYSDAYYIRQAQLKLKRQKRKKKKVKPAPLIIRNEKTGEVREFVSGKPPKESKKQHKTKSGYSVRLESQAQEAGFESYRVYLESPVWKAKRREVLNRDKWRCCRCKSKDKLCVHHRHYETLGEEKLDSLETLCESCHEAVHRRR